MVEAERNKDMADFQSSITNLAANIPERIKLAQTEEATKISCINPFIRALGYDTEDLTEVVPEYTADMRRGNRDKVDYAIFIDGKPVMLFECKAANVNLLDTHRGQLNSYFGAIVEVPIGVLTNGATYEFFTDFENANSMDDTPFWMVNLIEELDDDMISTLHQFSKSEFDLAKIKDMAEELKYVKVMKDNLREQLKNPGESFVKAILPQNTRYNSSKFPPIAKRVATELLRELILQSASNVSDLLSGDSEANRADDDGVVTTVEETEAFGIIKTILQDTIAESRLSLNDTKYYCGIIVDNNVRQSICRLRFGVQVKRVSFFNEVNEDVRPGYKLNSLSDINGYAEQLRARARMFA